MPDAHRADINLIGVLMPSKEITQFTRDLNGQSKAIRSMLPSGIDPLRFMRTVVNTVSTHPQSDRLLKANRQSLFSACQKAAGDGLLIDGRESTLVVFRDKKARTENVSYIPMVQGLVKLARNSGEIANIVCEVIYSNDQFRYRPGIDKEPTFDPDWFGDRGKPVGAYATVTTKDGEKIARVLPEKRIMDIARSGHNTDQFIPGKGINFEEWWRKTAIKNVLKYAPKSTELESALSSDNTTSFEIPDYEEPVKTEKDVTPEPPTAEEIQAMVSHLTESIEKATSKEHLIDLQSQVSELPIEHQEALVIRWNERAIKIKSAEKQQEPTRSHRPAADSGLDEHHINEPKDGEIQSDIA